MNTKLKLTLSQLAIAAIIFPANIFASDSSINTNRIYGSNRYETSINICNNFSSGTVKNVILASGNNFPDALAGSVLSKQLNAPILLVDKSLSESQDSISYIQNHLDKDGNVYILGGYASVSDEYVNNIKSLGFNNIKRLGGTNRFDTNRVIIESMNVSKGTPIVIVNGNNFPDALSVSSIAGIKGYPIVMSNTNELPDEIEGKISEIQPSNIYMIGGQGSLSNNIIYEIKKLLPSIDDKCITRIAGQDRYETSLNVCSYFNLKKNTVVIANGENFPDALSGSALAAKLEAPILLTDGSNITKQKEYMERKNYTNRIILGGKAAVNENVEMELGDSEKKHFVIKKQYVENGKCFVEGTYAKWVTDINEALEYEKKSGVAIVWEDDGKYYIPNDGFDVPIGETAKFEIDKNAEIYTLKFDQEKGNLSVKTSIEDFADKDFHGKFVCDVVIKNGVIVKIDENYRP